MPLIAIDAAGGWSAVTSNLLEQDPGLLGGFITTVAWVLWLKPHFYDLLEVIPGIIVSLILTITVSNFKSRVATQAKDSK